jgi:hypothetical protein
MAALNVSGHVGVVEEVEEFRCTVELDRPRASEVAARPICLWAPPMRGRSPSPPHQETWRQDRMLVIPPWHRYSPRGHDRMRFFPTDRRLLEAHSVSIASCMHRGDPLGCGFSPARWHSGTNTGSATPPAVVAAPPGDGLMSTITFTQQSVRLSTAKISAIRCRPDGVKQSYSRGWTKLSIRDGKDRL